MKALIIEDEKSSFKILEAALSPVATIESAHNGNEGYNLFKSALYSNNPFDVVFLDIVMPEIDGQVVLNAIRQLENEHGVPQCKIIMTSALEDGESIYSAHADGCTNYLVKPLSKERILRALE